MLKLLLTILSLWFGALSGAQVALAAEGNPETPPAVEVEADPCHQGTGLEALNACDRALASSPDDAVLWTIRGAILHEQLKRTPEALESHDRAVAIAPTYTLALYNRCVTLIALSRYEEALESCALALQGDGRWGQANPSQAWMNQGVALRRLRRYPESLAAYDRALELKPGYALAWNNRGVVLLELGRNTEAEAAFERAIELDPNNELARRNLEIVRQRQQARP